MNLNKTARTALTALALTSLGLSACGKQQASPSGIATDTSQATTATSTINTAKTQGIWIDVREAHEYAQGHLKDAVNITGRDLPSQIAGIAPDKNAQINLYCRSGNRSEKARQILLNMGYTNVINQGGYQQLYDKGYR